MTQAEEDVKNIEATIKALLPEDFLVSIGANVQGPSHIRGLFSRVFRIICAVTDLRDEVQYLNDEVIRLKAQVNWLYQAEVFNKGVIDGQNLHINELKQKALEMRGIIANGMDGWDSIDMGRAQQVLDDPEFKDG